jgi:hypothetical protein
MIAIDKETQLASIADARNTLSLLAAELISGGKNTHHIWQELRNVDSTLNYISDLVDRHYTELEKEVA